MSEEYKIKMIKALKLFCNLLAVLGLCGSAGFSLVAVGWGPLFSAVRGLLVAAAALAVEQGL